MEKVLTIGSKLGKTRYLTIKGEPWFAAKDVCDILQLTDVSKTMERLDDDEKLIRVLFVSGQNREMWFVNESGLYNLIFRSKSHPRASHARPSPMLSFPAMCVSVGSTASFTVPAAWLAVRVCAMSLCTTSL